MVATLLVCFSCSWATVLASRCSSFDTCFAFVLTWHKDSVREANASVVSQRQVDRAAARMECVAKASNPYMICGSRQGVRISPTCPSSSWSPTSRPARLCGPFLEFYLGSTLYNTAAYGKSEKPHSWSTVFSTTLTVAPTSCCNGHVPVEMPRVLGKDLFDSVVLSSCTTMSQLKCERVISKGTVRQYRAAKWHRPCPVEM